MKRLLVFFLSVFIVSISLQAQTDITIIKKTQTSNPLKKVLILSPVKNFENRKTLENEISWWMNDRGYAAYACNKLQKNESLPSSELIKSLVDENGFDGILISNLVDVQMKERYESNPEKNRYNPTVPTAYNYLDANQNAYNMGYNYNSKSFEVNTKLFEVDSDSVLFESNSNTYESSNIENAIEGYARSLSKALKKSKILEKKFP